MAATLTKTKISSRKIKEFRGQLLGWYDNHKRALPWRAKSGERMDPYKVWLSEIMCQQTTVTAVKPYYIRFLKKWPDVQALADAGSEEVMDAWAGLGYYARARNLLKCAKIVANDLGGVFPQDQQALKALPGIGDYTSAAITAIAFNKPAPVMDGNIERVVSRLFAVTEALPKSKPQLKAIVQDVFEETLARPGDLAQAFMDLGAAICIPKSPRCSICPLSDMCLAYQKGCAEQLPYKTKTRGRPSKYGHVYWIEDQAGKVLLQRRAEKGLLGGMIGLPTSAWIDKKSQETPAGPDFISLERSIDKKASIHHVFTHFDLELSLWTLKLKPSAEVPADYFWQDIEKIKEIGVPSVFKKALRFFHQTGSSVEEGGRKDYN